MMTEHDCVGYNCNCCCDCRYVTFDVFTVLLQHFCDSITLIFACIIIKIIIIGVRRSPAPLNDTLHNLYLENYLVDINLAYIRYRFRLAVISVINSYRIRIL